MYRFQPMLCQLLLLARLCAASLPRCGTSSLGPKFTGESKVRWSPVIPTWHSYSARQVSTLSLFVPWSPSSLDLHPWSPKSLDLYHWSPNSRSPSLISKLSRSPSSPRRAVTTRIRRVSGHLLLLLLIFVGSYSTPHSACEENNNKEILSLLRRHLWSDQKLGYGAECNFQSDNDILAIRQLETSLVSTNISVSQRK